MRSVILLAVVLLVFPTISHGQGEVSITQVNTLTSNYSVQAGQPARFVIRFNNTTTKRLNVSNGFKISSPDGALWDSVTMDSAGIQVGDENRFASYFNIVYALWGGVEKGGDGTNPDTVGMLAAGNPSQLNQGMPENFNDSAIALVVWMHDTASMGKHICIDSAFWGAGGTWVWVGPVVEEFFPSFAGLPGQPYSNGAGPERNGSGFCFGIGGFVPPGGDTVYVPTEYATIQAAVNAVNPNGLVLVGPGMYNGAVTVSGKQANIRAIEGPLQTTITGGNSTNLVTYIGPETNGSVLEGFTLLGGNLGIWCQNAAPIIRHNLLRSQNASSWAAIALSGLGWGSSGQSPAQILNNTIFGSAGGGISTFSTVAPTIKNTIIANNLKYGIHVQNEFNPQIMVSYNDVFGNPVAYYNVPSPGVGTIAIDPLFAGDFSLQGSSPCINAGDPSPAYNDPDGTRNDMGAVPFDTTFIPPSIDTLRVPQQYTTIQEAIDASHNGQVILVAPGSHLGGFNYNGKLVKVVSALGPTNTFIVPLITPDSVNMFDLVTFNHGEDSRAVLEGFTLQAGNIGVLCLGAGPTIRHNIFREQQVTGWAAICLAGAYNHGYASTGPAPAIIENNTIFGCANGGISTFSTVAPVIRNNIIYHNAAYGIHKQTEGLPLTIAYNDIYGNPDGNYNILNYGPGAMALDPKLDPILALTAESPCINAGDPDSMYNDPDGSRNDMGAVPFAGSEPSELLNLVQWRTIDGGNDHWYAVIPEKLYWVDANARARTFAQAGMTGYLATVLSAAENQFITDHVLVGANQQNQFDNFFIGGRETGGQWQWITGEPWGYSNWASGEPNNTGIETALCMYGHYDTYSHATPGTWNNSLPDGTVNTLHRYWSVVEFGAVDTSHVDEPIPTNEWISIYCPTPIIDVRPLPVGTVIRAYDPQGVLCGKGTVRADGSYGFISIYRDDPYTAEDEGAQPGDGIKFTLDGVSVTEAPDLIWTKNGDQFEICDFWQNYCMTLHLEAGWNLISYNTNNTGTPKDLLAPIINCVDVVLGFDNGGLVYDPQLEKYSTLTTMDYSHGYWIRMFCPADLEICGPFFPGPMDIRLSSGWNLISYLLDDSRSVEAGFSSILDNLQVAIGYDHGAKIYMPSNPTFNTLTMLERGKGYWVRMTERDILYYWEGQTAATSALPQASLSTGDAEQFGSRVWMSLYGDAITLDGSPLAINSTIEAFTAEGELVGRGQYVDGVLKFMSVYGNDGEAASARLAVNDDQLVLKVNGQEVRERVRWSGEGTSYRISTLSTGSLPSCFALDQNYPNPFNPATTISFAVPKRQHVRLVVFNLLGQEIRTLANSEYDAGRYDVVWDGKDRSGDIVPTGIYFYRLETGDIGLTRKMMLLK